MVRDLWAECRHVAHGTVQAVVMVAIAVALATAAYLFGLSVLAFVHTSTRLWAAHELQRLRDPAAIPALEEAAQDGVAEVRERVQAALESTRREVQRGSA